MHPPRSEDDFMVSAQAGSRAPARPSDGAATA